MEAVARRFEKYPADWGEYGHFGRGNQIWLLKGPIAKAELDGAAPDPATVYPTPGKDGWSAPVYFHDDRIDLESFFQVETGEKVVAYAFTYFDAPQEQLADLWLGSDEGMRIYLNGETVYDYSDRRTYGNNQLVREKVGIL